MDNLPVKAKDKKLNIFQKIRLEIFKRRNFTMDRYINAPEYIKADDSVIYKIIYNNNNIEENLLQIPEGKMLDFLNMGIIDVNKFSIEKQVELISKVPDLANSYKLDSERRFLIIDKSIESDLNSLIGNFDSSYQQEYLRYLKESGKLISTLPNILKFLDKGNINQIISQKPSLIIHLDEKQQIDYIQKPWNEKYFKYINPEIQLKYMKEKPEYIDIASDEAQEKFSLLDKDNFKRTTSEFQLKNIAKNPKAYKFCSEAVKDKVWENSKDNVAVEAAIALLKNDIRTSKYLNLADKRGNFNIYMYLKLFDNIQNEDIATIRKYFLHSKMLDAKGKLLPSDKALHGTSPEDSKGIDDYIDSQIEIIHKLNANQILELVSIDSNYILPYLTGNGEDMGTKQFYILNEIDINDSRGKCEKLFCDFFGKEKLTDISDCINIIYEMQREQYNNLKKSGARAYKLGVKNNDEISQMRSVEEIPMNQFKIIFNKNIIENNSIETINKYFEKYRLGQDNSEELKVLLEKAYGPHAREILEARSELDVHSLNSLEVFDRRIMENFGEAFVHDLISYNIRDFSGFLEVIKDENKLLNFKTYYKVLTNIMGNNVETMQKAFSEFIYNEELLENVNDVELTDKQYSNLISVLCSKNNMFNINSLEELQNFDEIANEITRRELKKTESIHRDQRASKIKQIISEHILGLDYEHNYKTRNYGDSFEYLNTIYDISSEQERRDGYTDSEQKILEVMDFIKNEYDVNKLLQISEELMNKIGIRNPIAIYSAIDKMKENQTEILNKSFLTIDKMEEACINEVNKENPLITKKIREDGLIQYSLEGIGFAFLQHSTTGFPLKDILNYEGQLGNNAICSRMIHSKNIYSIPEGLGYTNIEKNGLITYNGVDANTNHMSKLVRGTASSRNENKY